VTERQFYDLKTRYACDTCEKSLHKREHYRVLHKWPSRVSGKVCGAVVGWYCSLKCLLAGVTKLKRRGAKEVA
jgi:hypothetical protein